MSETTPFLPGLPAIGGKPVQVSFDGGALSSDAGVLVLAEIDRRLGISERLAACIEDPRMPERVRHEIAAMIRFRGLAIAAGYADANDCDSLRSDPAFKLAVGRLPESGADLCSQPTMSRLENLPGRVALIRMMAAMIDLFCDSFASVPRRIVLDIDDTEDRVHGQQQLSLFHAKHDSRCFLPIHIYEAISGKPVAVILRPGKTPSGLEVRTAVPCHPPHPLALAGGRDHRPRRFPLRPAGSHGLVREQPRRLHLRPRRQRGAQDHGRRHRRGDRPGPARRRRRQGAARWLYEKVYCGRGQAENLIKAHKLHLASDRTSCTKATANQFRLLIRTAAYWMLHSLRGLAPRHRSGATPSSTPCVSPS